MSDYQLPDDLKLWPRDPYQLLGVAPGVNSKDLRQAYTRLIRRFKPEQSPEHFRRIREAYEQVQQFGWLHRPPGAAESVPSGPVQNPMVADEIIHGTSARQAPVFQPRDDVDFDSLWERVTKGGEEHLVYRRLLECHHRPGSRDEVFLHLYWLLRAFPAVDPGQEPCHWLALGLRASWNSPCQELYRREIERRPSEALGERFNDLLQSAAPLVTLALWLEWRWQAAGRLGQWQVIAADVRAMRRRFAGKEDVTWARLLLSALDHLAWVNAPTAAAVVDESRRELEQLRHVHAAFDLSRLDILLDLAEAWKTLNKDQFPPALLRLIHDSWVRPFPDIREPLLAFLEDLLARPRSSLAMLDSLPPVVLGQFGHMVENLRYQSGFRHHDCPGLDRLVTEFLEDAFFASYELFRNDFLAFLLREVILVDQVSGLLNQNTKLTSSLYQNYLGYLHLASEDWPLRILSTAQCSFWG